jgi:nicotinate phosphoribosyltransferase
VVSGGFTVEKIRQFEERGVPADAYGVALPDPWGERLHGRRRAGGRKPAAKVGRRLRSNERLERVS